MNLYLLDAGGAGLIVIAFGAVIFFTALAIFIEAGVMAAAKYNLFKKALGDSALANIASALAGAILLFTDGSGTFDIDKFSGLLLMFAVTLVIELLVLQLRNKQYPLGKTLGICVLMNVVTYILLYLLVEFY